MKRERALRPVLLVAAGAALVSIWFVPQMYVGDYAVNLGPLSWLGWLLWSGAAAIGVVTAARALRVRRLPWIEALVSGTILVLSDTGWRVMTAHDADLIYKLVWVWIGEATPLIALATWAVAVTLALRLIREPAAL